MTSAEAQHCCAALLLLLLLHLLLHLHLLLLTVLRLCLPQIMHRKRGRVKLQPALQAAHAARGLLLLGAAMRAGSGRLVSFGPDAPGSKAGTPASAANSAAASGSTQSGSSGAEAAAAPGPGPLAGQAAAPGTSAFEVAMQVGGRQGCGSGRMQAT
jgi:hypothetical protein